MRWIIVGFVLLITGIFSEVDATHIRAGEITVERKDCVGLTFRITITGWVDLESTVEFGGGEIDFGDGSPKINLRSGAILTLEQDLGNNVGIVQFQIDHTYGANGVYILSYLEANRNAGVLNMNNSVETTFYIETLVVIDPFLGCNNTPILLIPPVDEACVGSIFFHNPGAWDADGDSISYEVTIPKRDKGTDVSNYRFPNDASFGGTTEDGEVPTNFDIDPITGDISWNSPAIAGEYNIAFIIYEWRIIQGQAFLMSWITRDMQIIVQECDNDRPELQVPEDVCVEAGTHLEEFVVGIDPDGDDVMLEAYGGPFTLDSSPATFEPFPPRFDPQPARGDFSWETNCSHIRTQPYQVTFKITDDPEDGPNLVGFEPWNITVVGPAPTGMDLSVNAERTIDLTWDPYVCSNAQIIQIWRRVDSYQFDITDCETGIPDSARYQLIDEVDPTATGYMDDKGGSLLDFGALYCYRIVAVFPSPGGGESYASTEVCGIIIGDAPVITNVSVENTHETDGEISIKWKEPFEIDKDLFPPPYRYRLLRLEGQPGGDEIDYAVIAPDLDENTLEFRDTGLNTLENAYNYRVILRDVNGNKIITSSSASSVFLSPKSLFKQIELRWISVVPWSNNLREFPHHFIYRDHVVADPNRLVLIANVNVNTDGFLFLDDGSFNGEELNERIEYCYYVITQGSYGNPKIERPLLNLSQIVCAQPNDTIPPCSPIVEITQTDCEAFLSDKPCSFKDFQNLIAWKEDETDDCSDETIKHYNVYFSKTGEEPFDLLAGAIKDEQYIHENLSSFAGCYYVTAVDRSDNESDPSEVVCNDNCPSYVLPNVFTPNDDGHNDFFNAMNDMDNPDLSSSECPRFVTKVNFRVFNRYGKEVFTFESGGENSILIGWDGRSNEGQQLASGVYYYTANVDYDAVAADLQHDLLKGWVQILR